MSNKKIVFMVLFALTIAFAVAPSCSITLNKAVIDTDNDLSANAGRVTVFGEGTGIFNDKTRVEINCNVDNANPGYTADSSFTARISSITQSQLAYTGGYCMYKTSKKDVVYKISARISLDDVACSGGYCFNSISCKDGDNYYATITVKASSKGDNTLPLPEQCGGENQKPCPYTGFDTPCPNGKTCYNGCMEPYERDQYAQKCRSCASDTTYARGICVKQSPQKPDARDNEKEFRLELIWKWSLIGVPYADISSEDHSCVSRFYAYDTETNAYQKVTDLTDKTLIGKGLWAKLSVPKSEQCIIKFKGKPLASQTIDLKKGWNLISFQTEKSIDIKKSTACKISRGPYTYSGFIENGKEQGYYKRDLLDPGTGYWIKVENDCKISSEAADDGPPPAPT